MIKNYYFGPSRKGVKLTEIDFLFLKVLSQQKLLSTKQAHTFYDSHGGFNYYSVLKKLKKWEKYDIVYTHKYSLGQKGFNYNYYRIGTKGIEILVDGGILSSDWLKVEIRRFSHVKNIDHFIGTQEIALRTLLQLTEQGISFDSISPFDSPYFDKSEPSTKLVVPDWIIKTDNLFFNIELDTGSEKTNMIIEKIKNYITLCKQNPSQKHVILISVIDDSIPTRFSYGEDRKRRVGRLKKSLLFNRDLHIPNLSIYILPLSRSFKIGHDVFEGYKPYSLAETSSGVELVRQVLETYNPSFEYKFKELLNEDVYTNDVPKDLYADQVFEVSNYAGTFSQTLFLIQMDEGNVQTLDRLNYLQWLISEGRLKTQSNKVLAYYTEEGELQHDVIAHAYEKVLLVDTQDLIQSAENQSDPIFKRLISPFRMEDTRFEE
ncbi:replication-relaxation family protein [Bacillus sp. AFS040349]|uniref:replication-relaxation family protein n=1 Tax=Bacillus sp. AFS040349 TaxID=2033502 RepID=UPI000BFB6F2D|nr:replication-relaxation family protein [Bacillus sp. AFS040349]PGT82215.1 hypothetical protein COD11_15580 [Bacillus sp. AFS040349]